MKFRELITETRKPLMEKADARIQHLEDMVLWNGTAGAKKAIDILMGLEKNPQTITVKWDGSPAVIFGRDERGEFILTDKSGFGAKGYDGKTKSAQALQNMLLGRGKEEPDENRKAFAANMAQAFSVFESAVPADFRGFMWGDLLYYKQPPVKDGVFVFKPQMVEYHVRADSKIGRRIAQSQAGVVVHMHIDLDGNKQRADASELNEGALLVMPPVTPTAGPSVDVNSVKQVAGLINQHGKDIDTMLDPALLTPLKLKNFNDILYSYINHKTKTQSLDNLAGEFIDWVDGSKLTDSKKAKVREHVGSHAAAFKNMFAIITGIMQAKNDVIAQLDNQPADVQAYTNGERGGEGYVIGTGDAKLVNRSGFSAANLNKTK